jgi:hypothetical protein
MAKKKVSASEPVLVPQVPVAPITVIKSRFQIDLVGLKKVGKGALIAGGAAVLAYLAEAIPGVNFGDYTPIIVAVLGILINAGRKFFTQIEQ